MIYVTLFYIRVHKSLFTVQTHQWIAHTLVSAHLYAWSCNTPNKFKIDNSSHSEFR